MAHQHRAQTQSSAVPADVAEAKVRIACAESAESTESTGSTGSTGSTESAESTETAEAVVRTAFAEVEAMRWDAVASLVHPETLKRFRE